MTEFEEQKMIEQAQAGDPKAKFEMSQWALKKSEEEPEEERWKRLAAKCLVEAAQAGYAPAQQMVQELMGGGAPAEPAAEPEIPELPEEEDVTPEQDAPTTVFKAVQAPAAEDDIRAEPQTGETPFFVDLEEPEGMPEDEEAAAASPAQKVLAVLQKVGAVVVAAVSAVAGLIARLRKDEGEEETPEEEEELAAPPEDAPFSRRNARSRESGLERWVNDNWKILGPVCIAVIVVMAVLIVLLFTIPAQEPIPEPTPTPLPTPTAAPTPTPEPFPNEATRTEINTDAGLSYRPAENEYLASSQSYVVDSDDGMNMRSGPSTDYDVLTRLDSQLRITAYASHQSGDETWYLVNTGGDWGWVIKDYLSK